MNNKTPINSLVSSNDSMNVIDNILTIIKKNLSGIESMGKNAMEKIMDKLKTAAAANDLWASHLITLPTFKCVDLDSTYRDRVSYPLPSDFIVPFFSYCVNNNAFNSADPVSKSIPYESGQCQVGTTANTIYLYDGAKINNYYIGNIIEVNGENRTIISYVIDHTLSVEYVTLSSPLSSIPAVGDTYYIKYSPPLISGNTLVGSTYNTIILPNTFSSEDDYYKGMFIRFSNGSLSNICRLISSYDGTTRTATLSLPLPTIPPPQYVEICTFSYNNQTPLRYYGSRTVHQYTCYNIQLMNISIPYQALDCGYYGHISDYPYIYIHFYNEPRTNENTIYSNNPGSSLATFKVGVNNASANNAQESNFMVLDNINVAMPVSIKLCPYNNIRFKVTLPNGEPIKFVKADNVPPAPPNPLLQISVSIGINLKQTVPLAGNFM